MASSLTETKAALIAANRLLKEVEEMGLDRADRARRFPWHELQDHRERPQGRGEGRDTQMKSWMLWFEIGTP
jgi:hypothetical protein